MFLLEVTILSLQINELLVMDCSPAVVRFGNSYFLSFTKAKSSSIVNTRKEMTQ